MDASPNPVRRRFRQRVALPIGLLVGGLLVVVVALSLVLASRQTADAIAMQRSVAEGMSGVRLAEMEKAVGDYSWWDDAMRNLVVAPDFQWADDNIGASLLDRYGMEMSFVVDPAGRTTYGSVKGRRSIVPIDRVLDGGIDQLLRERRRVGEDASLSGVLSSAGTPVLVSVAPIRPFKDEDRNPAERSVLVLADILDPAQLKQLARIYQLPGLRVVSAGDEEAASVEMRTLDGRIAVRLAWRARIRARGCCGTCFPSSSASSACSRS